MSTTVEWANAEKTILYFRVIHPWTWEDYYNATDEAWHMMQTVDHIVDFIVDLSGTRLVPSNAMSHLKRGATRTHPHKGMGVFVGVSGFMQVIINMMSHIIPTIKANVRTCSTLPEAYSIIEQEQQRRVSSVS
ncbi:MAG: hypothetical protein U0694_17520 [Anaerolineae bacterium]